MRRLFINNPQKSLVVDGDNHKHLSVVLRSRVGDSVLVCCGDGFDYNYTISSISKNSSVLELVDKVENLSEPAISVTLFHAVCKGEKNETIARMATELGLDCICPIITEFTIAKPDSYKVERLQRVALEAAKQSGRGKVPSVVAPIKFADMLTKLSNFDLTVFPYEGECNVSLQQYLVGVFTERPHNIKTIAIIVGSEGGFSKTEAQALINANITPVTLGKRILRADTAAAMVCAIVMCAGGQMQ